MRRTSGSCRHGISGERQAQENDRQKRLEHNLQRLARLVRKQEDDLEDEEQEDA
jgi:hypothetical protein